LTAPASTPDKSPQVTVTATDNVGLPAGATVSLDVDLNNDGDFLDAGESGYASGTLANGACVLTLTALSSTGTYPMRARVTDKAGNQGTSSTVNLQVTSASGWAVTGQVLTSDPLDGQAQEQLGNVFLAHPLDLDRSPGTAQSGNAALVYNSDAVSVKPIIQATIPSDNSTAL